MAKTEEEKEEHKKKQREDIEKLVVELREQVKDKQRTIATLEAVLEGRCVIKEMQSNPLFKDEV